MKPIVSLLAAISLCLSGISQEATTKKLPVGPSLSADFSPLFLLANGFRANISLGKKHWEYSLTSYSHRVFEDVQEIAFTQSEGITVENNTALQVVATWLPNAKRKNFFIGGGFSSEWYRLKDNASKNTIHAKTTYSVFTTGAQVFPFQELVFLKFQVNIKYALSGTKEQIFEGSTYEIARVTGIPHWAIGLRLPLAKPDRKN